MGQWLGVSLLNTNSVLHTPLYARISKRQSNNKKGDTMTVSCGVNPDTDSVEGRDGRHGRPPE